MIFEMVGLLQTYLFSGADVTSCPKRALGKVSRSLLPLEIQLTRFTQLLSKSPDSTWSQMVPGCDWNGVICNEADEPIMLEWNCLGMVGNLTWAYLPHSITWVHLAENQLSGAVDPESVSSLIRLDGRQNLFSSTLQLGLFPTKIETILLSRNNLYGTLDLTQLPTSVACINLDHNNFDGLLDISALPPSLQELRLSQNKLSGALLPRDLSEGIIVFAVKGNLLTGVLDLSRLPNSLNSIEVDSNFFDSVIPPNKNFVKVSSDTWRRAPKILIRGVK